MTSKPIKLMWTKYEHMKEFTDMEETDLLECDVCAWGSKVGITTYMSREDPGWASNGGHAGYTVCCKCMDWFVSRGKMPFVSEDPRNDEWYGDVVFPLIPKISSCYPSVPR